MKNLKGIALFCLSMIAMIAPIKAQTSLCDGRAMACNNLVYVSLDTACMAIITPDVVLEDPFAVPSEYEVRVFDPNGIIIPGDTILQDYDNQRLKVEIECIASGIFCWGYLIVEDKVPPVVEVCPKDTAVSCYLFDFDLDPNNFLSKPPTFTDNGCEKPDTLMIRDFEENFPCQDTLKLIRRVWFTFDAAGNEGRDTQCIYILKGQLSDIVFPKDTMIDCLDEGDLSPEKLGSPDVRLCSNLQITMTEVTSPVCGMARKILRFWKVVDTCTDEDTTATQIIEITDNTAPMMDFTAFRIPTENIQSDPKTCSATIEAIPNPIIVDCNLANTTLEIFYQLTDESGNVIGSPVIADPNPTLSEMDAAMTGQIIWDLNNVPLGVDFKVIFIANDGCGNISRDTSDVVRAMDTLDPNAVCEGSTTVQLTQDGTAEIMAHTFDDHSFDNCEVVDYKVRRFATNCDGNADDVNFGDLVHFCCDDVANSPIKVVLRVFDAAGNSSDCVVDVIVKDGRPITISCAADVTLDCNFDLMNLETELRDNHAPIVTSECGAANLVLEIPDNLGLNSCGRGTFTVIWRATGANSATFCAQQVTIGDNNLPTVNRPQLTINLNSCGDGTSPEGIPNSMPTVTNIDCEQIAITHEDEAGQGAGINCMVIKRTWTIIDWCLFDGGNSGSAIIDEFVQTINIRDQLAPVLAQACEDVFAVDSDKNCEEFIALLINATDDCTHASDISYSYEVDLDNNNTVDMTGSSNDASGIYPVGSHSIRFTIADQCGNSSMCSFDFTISTQKEPIPICNAFYEAVIQFDGRAVVNATDLNRKSTRGCGGEDGLVFAFDAAGTELSRTFTCRDIPNGVFAEEELQLWVLDQTNNTSSACTVVINLSDRNNNFCTNDSTLLGMSGFVTDENASRVANISVSAVNIETGESFLGKTDENGSYQISGLTSFDSYRVQPTLEGFDLAGLTTLDLVLIQRHILGLKDLGSGYQVLAADVNNSNSVTGADLVDLRRLILGKSTELADASWRFVRSDFQFDDITSPWNYPSNVEIQELADNQNNIDFVGLKIGDVNGNAFAVLAQELAGPRTTQTLDITGSRDGNIVSYTLSAQEANNIVGMQFALEFNSNELEFLTIEDATLNTNDENISIDGERQNVLKFSWTTSSYANIQNNELVTFKFKAKKEGSVPRLTVLSDEIAPEVYNESYETVRLKFNQDIADDGLSGTQFEVFQNKPNPFGDITKIGFTLPTSGQVTLDVVDVSGKRVFQNTAQFDAGQNEFTISKKHLSGSGIYYYSIITSSDKKTRRMIVLH